MNEFDFTLKFRLADSEADPSGHLEALAEAGCTDAVVGVGQPGRLALNFTREAESALEAVASAIADVHRAVPDAKLIEVTPDYVGVSDIAELFDFSRQNMLKLVQRAGGSFPMPVHEGKPSIWHLADVLSWFQQTRQRVVPEALLAVATVSQQVNLYKDFARLSRASGDFCFAASTADPKIQTVLDPVV